MDCDGMEDIWYVTVEVQSDDKIKVTDWDYMGDECDGSNDCYEKDSFVMTKDGNQYKVTEFGQIYTLEINSDIKKSSYTN